MLANQHVRFGERVTGDPLQGATAPYSTPRASRDGWVSSLRYASPTTLFTELGLRLVYSEQRLRKRVRSRWSLDQVECHEDSGVQYVAKG